MLSCGFLHEPSRLFGTLRYVVNRQRDETLRVLGKHPLELNETADRVRLCTAVLDHLITLLLFLAGQESSSISPIPDSLLTELEHLFAPLVSLGMISTEYAALTVLPTQGWRQQGG